MTRTKFTLRLFRADICPSSMDAIAGLNKKLKQARWFYALILFSTGVGVGLDFAGIDPVKALYWTAVINGSLAPFLLIAILVVASDKKLMQGQPSSPLGWTVVAITTLAMLAAGVAMFVV